MGKETIYSLIFAGGTGQRMNTRSKPKQFLEVYGKPIIIYTLEHFEYHPDVDAIVIVCIKEWIEELQGFLKRYGISKVKAIVPGGETGHDSIRLGLETIQTMANPDDIILIHDGVRPLITDELIKLNIEGVRKFGNAITAEPTRESVVQSMDGNEICNVPPRDQMYVAKAPQSFRFQDIYELYEKAKENGHRSIDSAHLLSIYHVPMHMIKSTKHNMKITDPADFFIFRALFEAIENQQVYGL